MQPEEINVTLDDNTHVLTVRGDHQEIHEHTAGDVVRHERTRKAFTRTFELPDNAKFTDITARINNGILNVYVPKKEERKKVEPRKIDVKTHAGSVEIPTTHVHSQPQAQAQVDNGAKGKAKA
jgi:HSP20 family protein